MKMQKHEYNRATFAGFLEERVALRVRARARGFAGCICGEEPSGPRRGSGQERGGGISRCGDAAAEGGGREPRHVSGGAAAAEGGIRNGVGRSPDSWEHERIADVGTLSDFCVTNGLVSGR